jgi:iron complex outermembrane receptor protein
MNQENKNKGVEVLIPAYTSVELGLFFFTQKHIGQLYLSGGARVDKKGIEFNGLQKDYGDLAGSFGATYEAPNNVVYKFNVARGYRAPNLSELGSNGAHEGTNRYEYGNTHLLSEKSLQLDLGTEWSNEHISIAGNLFYNMVTDYIFYQKLLAVKGGDSILVNDNKNFYAFAYHQQNAHLYGAEGNIDIHPHPFDGLHIENTLSYVRGVFNEAVDGSTNLPNIPTFRWIAELRYELAKQTTNFKNTYLSLQFDNVAAQNNPFTGYHTETKTPGYSLINVGLGTQMLNKGKPLFSISFFAQNLSDIAYQNSLSRLKYTDENLLTGRVGVFNMGRNFSLKINVPLQFN